MRGLLKYAFVLALGIAIGAYIVLDNIVPDPAEQGGIAARSEAAPPATPESIEEEELEYTVAKRLASLDGWRAFLAAHPSGAHAQSARAEIARRFGASSASADGAAAAAPALSPTDNEQAGALSQGLGPLAAHPQSATAKVERLPLASKVPASGDAEAPDAASLETSAAAPATDAAAGAKLAALDKHENETARSLPALASADAASLSGAICKRDEDRLVRLRASPSADEALRFAKELGCEKLRPQLQRLMESLDFSTPAPPPPAPADSPRSNPLLGQTCASERSALDRLRQEPSAEAAALFWREMQCEGLRPQVRLLLESLNVAPDSVGSAIAPRGPEARRALSNAPAATEMDSAACRREAAELNRVRATPDLDDAKRFASALTCDALRPQVARLLESFGD